MFVLKKECRTSETVDQIYQYMVNKGLEFKTSANIDSSPYYVLKSGTSIGYRLRSKWNMTGIVLFCAADGTDMKNIKNTLNLKVFDNIKDKYRPYAIFIPEDLFEDAVDILKKNPENMK